MAEMVVAGAMDWQGTGHWALGAALFHAQQAGSGMGGRGGNGQDVARATGDPRHCMGMGAVAWAWAWESAWGP